MATGQIKFFNKGKGYGFIAGDEGGDEIFFHCTNAKVSNQKFLKEGQKVSFVEEQGRKGLEAVDIEIIP